MTSPIPGFELTDLRRPIPIASACLDWECELAAEAGEVLVYAPEIEGGDEYGPRPARLYRAVELDLDPSPSP